MFAIREVDFADSFYFLGTPLEKMLEFAKKANITPVYGSTGVFDWAGTFSPGEYSHKYYSGRRMWRALSLMAPSLNLNPEYEDPIKSKPYPFSVKPERLLTPFDLMAIHRDWYGQNPWWVAGGDDEKLNTTTPYDMASGMAAGPYGTPNRYNPGEGESKV